MDLNEQEIKHITKALRPTAAELTTLTIASLLFLTVVAVFTHFQNIDGDNYKAVVHSIETYVRENILATIDEHLGVGLLTLAFWMLVGTLVYTLVWISISTYSAYKDDLPMTKGILFPQGYKKTNIIHDAVAKITMRTAALLLLLAWLYLLLSKITPYTIDLFTSNSDEGITKAILLAVVAVLFLTISCFCVIVLSRFALLRSRVFYK